VAKVSKWHNHAVKSWTFQANKSLLGIVRQFQMAIKYLKVRKKTRKISVSVPGKHVVSAIYLKKTLETLEGLNQGSHIEGEAKYIWPPFTN